MIDVISMNKKYHVENNSSFDSQMKLVFTFSKDKLFSERRLPYTPA